MDGSLPLRGEARPDGAAASLLPDDLARNGETGFNDTIHAVLTMAFVPLVTAAVVASAFAFRRMVPALRSRVPGGARRCSRARREAHWKTLPTTRHTRGLGAFERVNAYTLFAWMIVLALALLRRTPR